ncbi:unnamed protein product [Prunus armeniaca]|uniref:ER membrane protein complex subunit 6 n=1 Tax=Prunus armeniaca TaxID=36596 RepID=A0A6J5VZK5_PRUAR|nr:unnamed protein product [Prunus armeniaca]
MTGFSWLSEKLFVSSQKAEGMGGHNDSSASEKKLSEAANVVPTLNAENLQSNMKVIYYSRTFMSIIGGVIAGILGFTGLTGFIFYFLVMAVTSVGLIAKAGFTVHHILIAGTRLYLMAFSVGFCHLCCSGRIL